MLEYVGTLAIRPNRRLDTLERHSRYILERTANLWPRPFYRRKHFGETVLMLQTLPAKSAVQPGGEHSATPVCFDELQRRAEEDAARDASSTRVFKIGLRGTSLKVRTPKGAT